MSFAAQIEFSKTRSGLDGVGHNMLYILITLLVKLDGLFFTNGSVLLLGISETMVVVLFCPHVTQMELSIDGSIAVHLLMDPSIDGSIN